MDALTWNQRPELHRPVLVAAFAGWNDAGDAATGAARWLASQWGARDLASIDPEEFFDFTATRPVVHLSQGSSRSVEWPVNHFSVARAPSGRDVVFLHGIEPHLKWRTFCTLVLDVAREVGAEIVLTLGGLLADVPHTHPAPVTAHSTDPELLTRFNFRPSQYEGPTGVVGVLHHACLDAGIPSASLWVAVPHYVSQTASPKAMLALVRRTADVLDIPVDTTDLELASAAYERQVTDVVAADEEMAEYVAQLEANDESDELDSADRLAAEAERFLRGQGE